MNRNAPSNRWTREHGGRNGTARRANGGKVAHRTWLAAWWHAIRLNLLRRQRGERLVFPYECRWGQQYRDGETASKHWHVGHRSKAREGRA